ncbi:MAG: hypothetical protein U0V02_11590 [Anaerolineales bacterium]
MKKVFSFLANEVFLGTMIALLSVFTAVASYQGAMADSEQNKYEILGMQALNDGNAEYLSANQTWIQDDGNYDNWYINRDTNPEIAAYYESNFTEELDTAIARNGADEYPMDEEYATAIYADANASWEDSDTNFELGSQYDEKGDQLQLIMLIMALGLALAAWGSLLGAESNLRAMFSLFGLIAFITGIGFYVFYMFISPAVVAAV